MRQLLKHWIKTPHWLKRSELCLESKELRLLPHSRLSGWPLGYLLKHYYQVVEVPAVASGGGEPPPRDQAGLKEWIRNKLKALASLLGRLGIKAADFSAHLSFLCSIDVMTKTIYHSQSYNSSNAIILVYSSLLQLHLFFSPFFSLLTIVRSQPLTSFYFFQVLCSYSLRFLLHLLWFFRYLLWFFCHFIICL